MPAHVEQRGSKYRIVEPGGRLVKNKKGTPVDGGGHGSKGQAQSQASAINISQARKKGRRIPKK